MLELRQIKQAAGKTLAGDDSLAGGRAASRLLFPLAHRAVQPPVERNGLDDFPPEGEKHAQHHENSAANQIYGKAGFGERQADFIPKPSEPLS